MSPPSGQAELVIDQLAHAAEQTPHVPLLPERRGEVWLPLTNAEAWAQSGAIASWLIAQGCGPSVLEFAALANRAIDAAVAERRLHIDARTLARRRGDVCFCHGDFTTIAQAVGP